MSDEETEEYGTVKKKEVDININVQQGQGKKTEITDADAKALSEQLAEITGEDVEVATTVSEYKEQKRQLHTELAKEIGQARGNRSRQQALEKTRTEGGSTATGQAELSGEEATGEDFQGSTVDYGDIPISLREFPSREAMFKNLKFEANNPESEFRKEARDLLLALHRRIGKSREPMSAELQNVSDVARGKKAKWKIKREDER